MRLISLIALVLSTLLSVPASAQAPLKFALIVGESNYQRGAARDPALGNLQHPRDDAAAIAAQLEEYGFQTHVLTDADSRAILTALEALAARATAAGPGTVLLFYYGGHAVLRDGVDTLAPVGASLAAGTGLLPVQEVLSRLPPTATGANVVVLNACRNVVGDQTPTARTVFPSRGTILAYAAEPGRTSTDGQPGEPHSPYAAALLSRLSVGGTILQVLNGVAQDVEHATIEWTHPQRPQLLYGPVSDHCFDRCVVARGVGGPSGQSFVPDSCHECPRMMALRGDGFLMGSPPNETGRTTREGQQRWVSVPDFAIGMYEVTAREYALCIQMGECAARPSYDQWGPDGPVVNVTWDDARIFAAWLASQSRLPYRLLTESEWEYAARAGTLGRFSNSRDEESLCAIANHADATSREPERNATCSEVPPHQGAAPVGQFAANPWGLFDMHGNVWEWVQDCYGPIEDSPRDGRAAEAPGAQCAAYVDRGGAFNSTPQGVRSADRGYSARDTAFSNIGFRVGYTLPAGSR